MLYQNFYIEQAKIIDFLLHQRLSMELEVVTCMFVLMMILNTRFKYLPKNKQRIQFDAALTSSSAAPRYQYRPLIPYLRLNRFTFVGMQDVSCYHLIRFTLAEIQRLMPLVVLQHKRLQNRCEMN